MRGATLAIALLLIPHVRIHTDGNPAAWSSGTVIRQTADRAYILTVAHGLPEGRTIKVDTFPRGKTYNAKLERIDRTRDLALISIEAKRMPAITIAGTKPAPGDQVLAYGCDGRSKPQGYTQRIATLSPDFTSSGNPARPGRSGGAVMLNGKLVGITWGTKGNFSYLIDSTTIREFLHKGKP